MIICQPRVSWWLKDSRDLPLWLVCFKLWTNNHTQKISIAWSPLVLLKTRQIQLRRLSKRITHVYSNDVHWMEDQNATRIPRTCGLQSWWKHHLNQNEDLRLWSRATVGVLWYSLIIPIHTSKSTFIVQVSYTGGFHFTKIFQMSRVNWNYLKSQPKLFSPFSFERVSMDSNGFIYIYIWISNLLAHEVVVNPLRIVLWKTLRNLGLCITVVGGTLQENPRVGKGRPGKNTWAG